MKMQLNWDSLESIHLHSVHFRYSDGERNKLPKTGSIERISIHLSSSKLNIYRVGSTPMIPGITILMKDFREPRILSSGAILIEAKYTIIVDGVEKECVGGGFILIFTNPDNPLVSPFLPALEVFEENEE